MRTKVTTPTSSSCWMSRTRLGDVPWTAPSSTETHSVIEITRPLTGSWPLESIDAICQLSLQSAKMREKLRTHTAILSSTVRFLSSREDISYRSLLTWCRRKSSGFNGTLEIESIWKDIQGTLSNSKFTKLFSLILMWSTNITRTLISCCWLPISRTHREESFGSSGSQSGRSSPTSSSGSTSSSPTRRTWPTRTSSILITRGLEIFMTEQNYYSQMTNQSSSVRSITPTIVYKE